MTEENSHFVACVIIGLNLQCKPTFKNLFACPLLTQPLFFGHVGKVNQCVKIKTK